MHHPVWLIEVVAATVLLWPTSPAAALTADQLLDRVQGAVVSVRAFDAGGAPAGAGSGVVLPSGRVVTSCRRIDTATAWRVGLQGRSTAAALIAADRAGDLCLFEPADPIGTPARPKMVRLRQGTTVYAVGRPRGLEAAASPGQVIRAGDGRTTPIMTTAAVSPGADGGGLFDRRAGLVGLLTLEREGDHWLVRPVARALALDPGQGLPAPADKKPDWQERAMALELSGDWSGLLAWCRRWIKAEAKRADAWFALGTAYSRLGRTPAAIDAYRHTLRLDPQHVDAWFNLGLTYGRVGRHRDAIAALRHTLKIDPADAEAWSQLGQAYLATGNRETARAVANELERLDPERAIGLRQQAGMSAPPAADPPQNATKPAAPVTGRPASP